MENINPEKPKAVKPQEPTVQVYGFGLPNLTIYRIKKSDLPTYTMGYEDGLNGLDQSMHVRPYVIGYRFGSSTRSIYAQARIWKEQNAQLDSLATQYRFPWASQMT